MSYMMALGPQHPALGGPQRLILTISADRVTEVEYRPGVEPGRQTERLVRFDLERLLSEVGRICERSRYAHMLAFCQAVESLLKIELSPRAARLRVAVLELERIIAHLEPLAALFSILGLDPRARQLDELQAEGRRLQSMITGDQFDLLLPGGLRRDLTDNLRQELLVALKRANRRLYQFSERVIDTRALLARTVEVGTLSREAALQFALSGPVARASGLNDDLRISEGYAAYGTLEPRVISQEKGDVYARLVTLLLETLESMQLVERALHELPDGQVLGALPATLSMGTAMGAVESPHGALRYRLECDGQRITNLRIEAPRQIDRLLARTLLSSAWLDNVVLIMRSVDPCPFCMAC